MSTIGDRIKTLRHMNQMSQETMGTLLNVSQIIICKYETGAMEPPVQHIKIIAKIFGVSTDYILLGSEVPTSLPESGQPAELWENNEVANDMYIGELRQLTKRLPPSDKCFLLKVAIALATKSNPIHY